MSDSWLFSCVFNIPKVVWSMISLFRCFGLRKVAISYAISVCLSMFRHQPRLTGRFIIKYVNKFSFGLKSGENNRHFTWKQAYFNKFLPVISLYYCSRLCSLWGTSRGYRNTWKSHVIDCETPVSIFKIYRNKLSPFTISYCRSSLKLSIWCVEMCV